MAVLDGLWRFESGTDALEATKRSHTAGHLHTVWKQDRAQRNTEYTAAGGVSP